MILKEFFLSPAIFDKEYCTNDKSIHLIHLFRNIQNNGFLLSLNNQEWYNNVSRLIYELKNSYLMQTFKNLADRKKIEYCKESGIKPQNEKDWLNIAKGIDSEEKIDFIFATNSSLVDGIECHILDELLGELGDRCSKPADIKCLKNSENLEKIFQNVLRYARKVQIIDPFFYIDEKKSLDSLLIMAESVGKNVVSNIAVKPRIIVNCYYKKDKFFDGITTKWENILKEIMANKGVMIEIIVWNSRDFSDRHERYLLTDKIGIKSGAGFDILDNQDSNFSTISSEDSDKLRKIFDPNYPQKDSGLTKKYTIKIR